MSDSSSSPSPPNSDDESDTTKQCKRQSTSLSFKEIRCTVTYLGEVKYPPVTIIDQPHTNDRKYHIQTYGNSRGVHFVNRNNLKSMSSSLPLSVFMPHDHYQKLRKILQNTAVGSVISDGVNYYSIISESKNAKNISFALIENTFRKLVHYIITKGNNHDLHYISRSNRSEFRPDRFLLTFTNSPIHLTCIRLIKLKKEKEGYTYKLPPSTEIKKRGEMENGTLAFTPIFNDPKWVMVIKDTSNPSQKTARKRKTDTPKVDAMVSPIDPTAPGLILLTPKAYRGPPENAPSPIHPHNVSHSATQDSPAVRRSLFASTTQADDSLHERQLSPTQPSTSTEQPAQVADITKDGDAGGKRKRSPKECNTSIFSPRVSPEEKRRHEVDDIEADLQLSESSKSSSSSSGSSSDSSDTESGSGSDTSDEESEKLEGEGLEKLESEKIDNTICETPKTSRLHQSLMGTIIQSSATTTPHFVDEAADENDTQNFITPKDPDEIRYRIEKFVQEQNGDWFSPAARMRTNTQVNLVARQGSKTLKLNPLREYVLQRQKSRKKV